MEPYLANNDKEMFYKYLNDSNVYFEFGSGGSTYQASIRDNIKKIYTVESDILWFNKMKSILTNNNITFIFNDLNAQPNNFGRPGPYATNSQKINYSNHILYLSEKEQQEIDFILIDGRFRVACCLKCFDIIKNDCLIAFDDFLNRPQYHIVLTYFDIIDKTDDNRMVILKKKMNAKIPNEIIKNYELIHD